MTAVMTIVMCLAQDPTFCEVREFEVEAWLCAVASRNVAEARTPPGYRLHASRCRPRSVMTARHNVG